MQKPQHWLHIYAREIPKFVAVLPHPKSEHRVHVRIRPSPNIDHLQKKLNWWWFFAKDWWCGFDDFSAYLKAPRYTRPGRPPGLAPGRRPTPHYWVQSDPKFAQVWPLKKNQIIKNSVGGFFSEKLSLKRWIFLRVLMEGTQSLFVITDGCRNLTDVLTFGE